MSYDGACYDLAQLFLEPEEHSQADIASLAQTIQDAIEGWFFVWEDQQRRGESANVVATKGHRRGA